MSRRISRLLIVALLSTCAASGALAAGKTKSSAKSTKAAALPSLVWRGDYATARGVVDDVAKAWEKSGKGRIEIEPFNTASGLDAVAHGLADVAGSARGSAGGAETDLQFMPVAYDALVMITHPSNPTGNLTVKQLHDIYFGKITNWKDVGGKDAPINLYAVASPGDGVEYSLRRLIFGRGNQPVAAPRLYVNTAKLEEAVTLDPNALGVTTLSGVANNGKVKMVSVNGTRPSLATVTDGSYTLYTPLYLVTNANSPKAAVIQQFMEFLHTDTVKALARQHQLVPYSDAPELAANDTLPGTHRMPTCLPSACRSLARMPGVSDASMHSMPAPDSAILPRWIMCHAVASPRSAEYWHIGETTMRLGSVTLRSVSGEKSALMDYAL